VRDITKTFLHEYVCYEDGLLFRKKGEGPVGTLCPSGYSRIKIGGRSYQRARLVWIWHRGAIPDGEVVDHSNGRPWDDRINNLRLVSNRRNQSNKRNTSEHGVGVTRLASGWFRATIERAGKKKILGYSRCKVDAGAMYGRARAQLEARP